MQFQSEFQAFLDSLEDQLRHQPVACQVAFAAACCERHFGEYVLFGDSHHWGDREVLRLALDMGWAVVEGGGFDRSSDESLLARCMRAVPSSDQFSAPLADSAQNVAIMVVHLVEFLGSFDLKLVVMIASLG